MQSSKLVKEVYLVWYLNSTSLFFFLHLDHSDTVFVIVSFRLRFFKSLASTIDSRETHHIRQYTKLPSYKTPQVTIETRA